MYIVTTVYCNNYYSRVKFIPCNRQCYYVLEISVRPGDPFEIYSDGEDKVSILGSTTNLKFPCMHLKIGSELWQ